jgi:hypothetical protein
MIKLVMASLTAMALTCGCGKNEAEDRSQRNSDVDCKKIAESMASNTYIQPYMQPHVVNGSEPAKMFKAPDDKCSFSDKFIKPGDYGHVHDYSKDNRFAQIFIGTSPEESIWIESKRLDYVGSGKNPNEKPSCKVHAESIVESDCKWSPPAPRAVAELNDEQAYCDQKERADFEKTHQRQDYFLVETKGRTPLYSLPDEQCKSKKFLIQGDLVDLIEFYPTQEFGDSTYARVIYFSKVLNRDVVGWVPSKTLCRLTASGGNCENVKRR